MKCLAANSVPASRQIKRHSSTEVGFGNCICSRKSMVSFWTFFLSTMRSWAPCAPPPRCPRLCLLPGIPKLFQGELMAIDPQQSRQGPCLDFLLPTDPDTAIGRRRFIGKEAALQVGPIGAQFQTPVVLKLLIGVHVELHKVGSLISGVCAAFQCLRIFPSWLGYHDREVWQSRHRPPPITQLQLAKWRHWRPAQLRDLEPTTQRALEEKLRQHWSNRLISHLAPHASDIPAMAAVMGGGNDHEEFLHLLGDARFSTLRQRCLALEKLKKHGGLQIPWTEKSVRSLLSNLHKEECSPNYIQQAWDTLKWFSTKFQTLDVTATHRLASKKKWLQETLVSTAATPQRKAVVPAKEVILALEQGAAACGADPRRKGQVAREAIDAFILGMVRFQVGSSARFNDLQHTSPITMKITSNTIEMMAWQTKTASAFPLKKNPVPLIAPKLSLSGVDSDFALIFGTLSGHGLLDPNPEQGFSGSDTPS